MFFLKIHDVEKDHDRKYVVTYSALFVQLKIRFVIISDFEKDFYWLDTGKQIPKKMKTVIKCLREIERHEDRERKSEQEMLKRYEDSVDNNESIPTVDKKVNSEPMPHPGKKADNGITHNDLATLALLNGPAMAGYGYRGYMTLQSQIYISQLQRDNALACCQDTTNRLKGN